MKVQGKILVVTGGGNGIGRQLVLQSLSRGASVAAVDIRQESLDETVELAGNTDRIATFIADVTDRDAIEALPSEVVTRFGSVDGIINNAGIIQPFVRFNDLEYDAIDRVLNVNLFGTIHVTKSFLPYLMDRPVAHIANVSSMGGFLAVPGQTIYCAAKAGVKLLTEGLYAELMETNVSVSVVMPGAIATDITANSGVEIPGGGDESAEESSYPTTSPEDAARIILDGIESDKLHIYVGKDSKMMSIAKRTAPRRSIDLIQKQMKDLLPS